MNKKKSKKADPLNKVIGIKLNRYQEAMFNALLDKPEDNQVFTKRDIFKIANLHPDCFNEPIKRPKAKHKELMRQIYKAIDEAGKGYGAFIPKDFRNFAKK